MIHIRVNGNDITVDHPMPIEELLRIVDVPPNYLAVEVNDDVVPRDAHGKTIIVDGDRVEVVTLVGGG